MDATEARHGLSAPDERTCQLAPMDRFGYSIFCDDIRNEPGGKLSFVGCYNGVLFVPRKFPFLLSRFCVHIHVLSPPSRPYSALLARCYAPGEDAPVCEEQIQPPSKEQQLSLAAQAGKSPFAPLYIVAGASLIFQPLRITEPGLLRVRALADDETEEIKLGSLRIEAAPTR